MIQPQFNFLNNPRSFAFIRGHFPLCSPWFIFGSGLSGLGKYLAALCLSSRDDSGWYSA
jgi:hypothetical protein